MVIAERFDDHNADKNAGIAWRWRESFYLAQAGSPVESQSVRQVRAAVKKWKREKQKKSSTK